MRNILSSLFFLMLGFATWAQENQLIDRNYWKTKPSVDEIKVKIQEGHSPSELNSNSFDAICYAILEENPIETIQFLLTQGNDVNKITHDARTYLFWAAYKSNIDLMNYLVDMGGKTNLIDQHGYTVMLFAATNGVESQAVYEFMKSKGASLVTEKDRDGRNVLLAYAGSTKTGNLFDYFIKQGLKMTSVDNDGNGIFNHAAKTGNKNLMELLRTKYKVNINKNPETNENAILFASRRSSRGGEETNVEFYQYLESLGMDPVIVSKSGNTALHNIALRSNNPVLFDYFLSKGLKVDHQDSEGNNALILAASGRSLEIVTLMTEQTQDINHRNKEGWSAFDRALRYNNLEVAMYLQSMGATYDPNNSKIDLGFELVDAFNGNLEGFNEKLNYLIRFGYNPKNALKKGKTLVHAAVSKGNAELINQLLTYEIDINAKDANGQTALHLAAMQTKDPELLKFLITAGADKKLTTEFEESAYELAKANELLSSKQADIEFLKGK